MALSRPVPRDIRPNLPVISTKYYTWQVIRWPTPKFYFWISFIKPLGIRVSKHCDFLFFGNTFIQWIGKWIEVWISISFPIYSSQPTSSKVNINLFSSHSYEINLNIKISSVSSLPGPRNWKRKGERDEIFQRNQQQ